MDWNRDGKVDGHDMVHFHEVINSDSNSAPAKDGNVSGGNGSSKKQTNQAPVIAPKFEVSQLGKVVLGLTAFISIAMLFEGGIETFGTTLGIGFVAFLVAQLLDG